MEGEGRGIGRWRNRSKEGGERGQREERKKREDGKMHKFRSRIQSHVQMRTNFARAGQFVSETCACESGAVQICTCDSNLYVKLIHVNQVAV